MPPAVAEAEDDAFTEPMPVAVVLDDALEELPLVDAVLLVVTVPPEPLPTAMAVLPPV